jgi:hypothetical protein
MDLESDEKLIFEFFESRSDLKDKFYDCLHYIVFDGDNSKFKNLIISYQTQIDEYSKTKEKQNKNRETEEKTSKNKKKQL